MVWTASHPLGPWSYSNIDLNPLTKMSNHFIKAQESFVIKVNVTGNVTYLYVGDMWDSASDHLKSHDLAYTFPLVFNDSLVPPAIAPLQRLEAFQLKT